MRTPKILVVGSLVMDHIITTEIFPEEGATVLGQSFAGLSGSGNSHPAYSHGFSPPHRLCSYIARADCPW